MSFKGVCFLCVCFFVVFLCVFFFALVAILYIGPEPFE